MIYKDFFKILNNKNHNKKDIYYRMMKRSKIQKYKKRDRKNGNK